MKSLVRGTSALFFVAAILFATTQPASALLYGSYGAALVGDNLGDSKSLVNPSGGTDIAALYFANNGGFDYFRMDLNGAATLADSASFYNIIINSSTSSNINGLTAVVFPIPIATPPFAMVNVSPGVSDFQFSDGKTLEWKIPETQLVGAFSINGLTFSTASPFILDDTKTSVVPIPSAALLLGTGLVGLVGLRRRGFRKA